jgi:hypothetical protein
VTDESTRADDSHDIHRLLARSHGAGLTYRRFDEPAATSPAAQARAAVPAGSAAALFPLLAEALPEFASIEAGSGGSPDSPIPPPSLAPPPALPPAPPPAPPVLVPAYSAPPYTPPAPVAPPATFQPAFAPAPQAPSAPPAATGGTPLGNVFRLLGARPSTVHNPFFRR